MVPVIVRLLVLLANGITLHNDGHHRAPSVPTQVQNSAWNERTAELDRFEEGMARCVGNRCY